jgi:hypothetical protein
VLGRGALQENLTESLMDSGGAFVFFSVFDVLMQPAKKSIKSINACAVFDIIPRWICFLSEAAKGEEKIAQVRYRESDPFPLVAVLSFFLPTF